MSSFRSRQITGRRAVLTLAVLLLGALSAAAGIRDVRVVGEAPVRTWAARNAPAVEVVRSGSFVTLEGTVQAPWYRVRTTTGRSGWLAGTIAEGRITADEGLATKPTLLSGSLRLLTGADLRGGPVGGRPVDHQLAAGTIVRVLEQYGTWVLLADSQGRSGWTEASTFVAAVVAPGAVPEREPDLTAAGGKDPDREAPTGAELREIRLEERRAAREAAEAEEDASPTSDKKAERAARKLEAEQRKAAKEADKAAERAAASAEREAAEAERAAAQLARETEAEAVAEAVDPDEDEADERRAAREAKEAERQAARDAKQAEKQADREAKEAEKQAARDAKEAAKLADREPESDEIDTAEAKRAEAAASKERERADAAARKEAERAEKEAEKQAAREAKEAERLAKKAGKGRSHQESTHAERQVVQVQELPTGPVAPADIPPSLGVSLDGKAPSEKKPDPGRSPLASEVPRTRNPSALPVLDPAVVAAAPPSAAAAELLEGFQPYDDQAQVGRSVEAVHEDPKEAMDLSFAARPSALPSSFYVNDEGDMVDTRIVSEIVLRVGSEILTLGEFERRVDETREAESVRSGQMPSLDQVRRTVLAEMVDSLVLIHHGRAIGIRFDVVYESAKDDFKKRGGLTDDLELLRILDEMGMTFKDFRREMIRRRVPQIVVRTQVMSDVTVQEEEIGNYYRRHQDEWSQQDCVRLRELVLQPEARETTRDFNLRLEEILDRMEGGEDFCDLARRHSRSPSAAQCGELEDCFAFEQLDEKVARVVFKMRPGDVEPVRTDWGFHLLRLEEHRPGRVRGLEEVRADILRRLQIEKLAGDVPRFIEGLRRTVRIEVSPAFQRYWDEMSSGGGLGQ